MIFDADPVVYGAGFAAEMHSWEVVAEDCDGKLYTRRFDPHPEEGGAKERANKWVADNKLSALDWNRIVTPEPKEFALQAVSTQIRGAIKAVSKRTGVSPRDLVLTVLLSGPGNFREKLATLKPYKGNRDPEHKPYWYAQIREYLTERWGATVVTGREADDEVSILAWQHIRENDDDGYVICTIDKDLDQVPGMHYDYKKHVHYDVSFEDAKRWFYVQTLAGDPTDNIGGAYKIGMTKAEKIVDGALAAWDENRGNVRDTMGSRNAWLWDVVVNTYQHSQLMKGCPYADKPAAAVALENARLVYMQREVGELWTPPPDYKPDSMS